jgi:RNA polymerase sigma-70 factor (ECF subfamily)
MPPLPPSGSGLAQDDATLLAAARQGDAAALDALIGRWQGQVYRFGLRMCGDQEDARDVLQDTLLAAARSLRDFRGESAVSTWLFRIARSFCTKHRRRSVFAPREELSLEALRGEGDEPTGLPPASGHDPEQATAAAEVRRALDRAIRALDPKYREVLLLRDVEGLTAPEVARVLGLRVETVKTRLHRARLALRREIGPLLTLPGPLPPASFAPPRDGAPGDDATGRGEEPQPHVRVYATTHAATDAPEPGRCPDLPHLVSRYLEGEVGPELCSRLERHVAQCPRCAEACAELRETVRLCRELPLVEDGRWAPTDRHDLDVAVTALRQALRPV